MSTSRASRTGTGSRRPVCRGPRPASYRRSGFPPCLRRMARRRPTSACDAGPLQSRGRCGSPEHLRRAVEMSRLYEALAAIEGKPHVLARTDLPRVEAERWARHRRSVIVLGAVVVFGVAGLTVVLRAQ